MSDRLNQNLKHAIPAQIGGVLHAVTALFVAMYGLISTSLVAQVGGRGADPIPAFVQNVGGGGASESNNGVAFGLGPNVVFDPSSSYLPAAPVGQTYQYKLTWDFGDATAVVVKGPDSATNVLIPVPHTFPIPPVFPAAANIDPNTSAGGLYVVTLTIDVTIVNQGNISSPGPSGKTTSNVRSAETNYGPTCSLVNLSSPATGALPYQINVDCSRSYDEDGFIIWGAISWGDGTSDLLRPLPPSTIAMSSLHSYTTPGIYQITLSLIDNGRLDVGTVLQSTPSPVDPFAALTTIQTVQRNLIDSGTLVGLKSPTTGFSIFNPDRYLPILRQQSMLIQVPGNLMVVKGKFGLDFQNTNSDSIDITFVLNGTVSNVALAQISLYLGYPKPQLPLTTPIPIPPPASLVLNPFTTDRKGNYFNSAQGLKFSIDPKRKYMRIQIKQIALQKAFQIGSATVVNGFVDIPVTIGIVSADKSTSQALSTILRFAYKAQAGASGTGTNPRSTQIAN